MDSHEGEVGQQLANIGNWDVKGLKPTLGISNERNFSKLHWHSDSTNVNWKLEG